MLYHPTPGAYIWESCGKYDVLGRLLCHVPDSIGCITIVLCGLAEDFNVPDSRQL